MGAISSSTEKDSNVYSFDLYVAVRVSSLFRFIQWDYFDSEDELMRGKEDRVNAGFDERFL